MGYPNVVTVSVINTLSEKFTGHFWKVRSARDLRQEGGLGIYHAQARMYDPVTGRFWGVDAMRSVKYVDSDGYRYNVINTSKN